MIMKNLPGLLYNIGPKSLDPDFLYVTNIWRRAEVLTEFKAQISMFVEDNVPVSYTHLTLPTKA